MNPHRPLCGVRSRSAASGQRGAGQRPYADILIRGAVEGVKRARRDSAAAFAHGCARAFAEPARPYLNRRALNPHTPPPLPFAAVPMILSPSSSRPPPPRRRRRRSLRVHRPADAQDAGARRPGEPLPPKCRNKPSEPADSMPSTLYSLRSTRALHYAFVFQPILFDYTYSYQ